MNLIQIINCFFSIIKIRIKKNKTIKSNQFNLSEPILRFEKLFISCNLNSFVMQNKANMNNVIIENVTIKLFAPVITFEWINLSLLWMT